MAAINSANGGAAAVAVELRELRAFVAKFAAKCPGTRVVPRHLSTAAAQFAALRGRELDVALVRERSPGPEFDGMLVARENLGVLIASELAAGLVGRDGIRLDALRGLKLVGFGRPGSPARYDELTAIVCSHGIDVGPSPPDEQPLIPAVKFPPVNAGHAFALAPENGLEPLPDTVTWAPLVGHPLVRRTWVVWPATSRRRDVAQLIKSFDLPEEA